MPSSRDFFHISDCTLQNFDGRYSRLSTDVFSGPTSILQLAILLRPEYHDTRSFNSYYLRRLVYLEKVFRDRQRCATSGTQLNRQDKMNAKLNECAARGRGISNLWGYVASKNVSEYTRPFVANERRKIISNKFFSRGADSSRPLTVELPACAILGYSMFKSNVSV
jgi:hypothetical protein